MGERKYISARETYVLDEEDLKELDDASLTGVMRDVTESIKQIALEQERRAAETGDGESEDDEFDLGFLMPDDTP